MNRLVVIAVVFSVMLLLIPVAATTPPAIPTTGVVFTPLTMYTVHANKLGFSNSSDYIVVTP